METILVILQQKEEERRIMSNYRKNKEFGQEKTMISSSLKRIKQR